MGIELKSKKDIVKYIMHEIGLDIDNESRVVDQDTGTLLKFYDKSLKYSENDYVSIDKDTEIFFNIFNNLDLATNLFSYYLKKIEISDGIYYPVYFTTKDPNNMGMSALIVKNANVKLETNYYRNMTLMYIEMILKISGNNINLSKFEKNT